MCVACTVYHPPGVCAVRVCQCRQRFRATALRRGSSHTVLTSGIATMSIVCADTATVLTCNVQRLVYNAMHLMLI